MDDAELLRQALAALKEAAPDTLDLQRRIAARLAEIYGGGAPAADPAGGPGPDPAVLSPPGR